MSPFREICCAWFSSFDAFDSNSGDVVGNSCLTCLIIPAASLKSSELLCAFESVESIRFPLISTNPIFFEFSAWQTVCTKSKLCWLLSSSNSRVGRCCCCTFVIVCLFRRVIGAFPSFMQGRSGHSVSLVSSLICVGCFASALLKDACARSMVASWLRILDIESACPMIFPLRWTIYDSKVANVSSQRAVIHLGFWKYEGSAKLCDQWKLGNFFVTSNASNVYWISQWPHVHVPW